MQLARPRFAIDPQRLQRRFGRGPARVHAVAQAASHPAPVPALGDDAKLFTTTFAAGFLFVSCLIA